VVEARLKLDFDGAPLMPVIGANREAAPAALTSEGNAVSVRQYMIERAWMAEASEFGATRM
jgi:hypothetical protein